MAKKESFRKYFEEMDLNEKQIEQRVEHSEELSPILFFIINLVLVYIEKGYTDFTDVEDELRNRYIELLGGEGVDIDNKLIEYVEKFSKEFVNTTVKHAKVDELNNLQTSTENNTTSPRKEYTEKEEIDLEQTKNKDDMSIIPLLLLPNFFISELRADMVAESEANVIYNLEDYKQAIKDGKKYKMWVTERDERVRETHKVVDSETIEIDQYFRVGDSYMLYPKDMSMNPNINEVSNCRCVAIYI